MRGDDTSIRNQRRNPSEAVQSRISRTLPAGLALIAALLLAVQPVTHARGPEHPVLAGSSESDKSPSHPAVAKGGPGDIDFESDEGENQPNGFQSVDDPRVRFFDSIGEHLQVDTFGPWSDGRALRVGDNDPSLLTMMFDEPMGTLSLDFGNDQPSMSNPGDEAVLGLFQDGHLVDQVTMMLNRNGNMDQTITYAGECFNSATFIFDVSTAGAAEIVDNIQFEPCGQVGVGPQTIPAVSTEGLVLLAVLLLAFGWRYRPSAPAG